MAAERQEYEMSVMLGRQKVKERRVAAAAATVRDRFATLARMRPVGQGRHRLRPGPAPG